MTIPQDPNPTAIAQQWLADFAAALYAADAEAIADTIHPDGWFRDVLTFTWDNRTLEGREKITAFFAKTLHATQVSKVKMTDNEYMQPQFSEMGPARGVEFAFSYETSVARGTGYARLLQGLDGEWKGHTVAMITMDLKGHEELSGRYSFEQFTKGKTWGEYTAAQKEKWETDPYVIVVGGGQIGLQVAARLKNMGISNIVVERNKRIGDNWRKRYASLALHTVKEHHQLLYQPHPSNWPLYPPRDRVANMLETYAITQELIVWTNSYPIEPVYNEKKQRWTVTINRDGKDVVLHPGHIVIATGTLGAPNIPSMGEPERFKGEVFHSSQYNVPAPFKGKKVVVVGAGNSSVDICQDLAEGGAASVTMIQRSPMAVSNRDKENIRIAAVFTSELPIEVNDLKVAAVPRGYLSRMASTKAAMKAYREFHKETIEKVEKGGFMVRPDKPQITLWLDRLGGYWLDKGAGDLIASGAIKVKAGVEAKSFTESGIVLTDGSELPADTVILATGYHNMREVNKQLFGAHVIDKTRKVWGLDEEGEMSGSFRPSGYPGLWFAAGEFGSARFGSRGLGILIKAVELGLYKQT